MTCGDILNEMNVEAELMNTTNFERHCRTHSCRDCSFYNFKMVHKWSIPCLNIFEKMENMRNDYCITKADRNCDSCPFSFHKNGLVKACHYLTAFEIADIFNKIEEEKKEDKTMSTTELEQEIAKTKEQLERLEKALDKAKNKVPEQLEWDIGEKYWVVDSIGNIIQYNCNEFTSFDKSTHHMFKTKDYAKLYAEKTKFIADLLHFKWLYDRDYVPNWSSDEKKYKVYFNYERNEYNTVYVWHDHNIETVYFSTQEIAKKCADWLNSRRKEE